MLFFLFLRRSESTSLVPTPTALSHAITAIITANQNQPRVSPVPSQPAHQQPPKV
ncbi:hypothetical protein [Leuconostoc mesenteroides]|uniref:hypothetical protein n=1 Tax=Leuconostoc mesenteroides TaxID=1245 RepID=UPI003993FBC4